VSLPTLALNPGPLPAPTLLIGLRQQSFVMCPSRLQLKQLAPVFRLLVGNPELKHLLDLWPNLLHLLRRKCGPLAAEGDLSFTERIALSSYEISMAWDRRIGSTLLRTMV
jgi:hypothetical protein